MARRTRRYDSTLLLGALTLLAGGVALWSNRQVPDSVLLERRGKLLPSLRRDAVQRIELQNENERFELFKEEGRWYLSLRNQRIAGDDTELERILTEAEFASPSRTVGPLDASTRQRFGLDRPRVRVTFREAQGSTSTIALGGSVAGEGGVYAEVNGTGYVVARSFADAWMQRSLDMRSHDLSDMEPSRTARIEITGEGGPRSFEQRERIWYLTVPYASRAGRARMDAMLNALRDLRAVRFIEENPSEATLTRLQLQPARMVVRATRDNNGPTEAWNFGGLCPGHDDEVVVRREGQPLVACVAGTAADDIGRLADTFRDNHALWARADEIERVRVHGATGEFSVRREGDHWSLEGATGALDPESIDAWINSVQSLTVETFLGAETAATHGIDGSRWIEVTRTGMPGSERLELGAVDADRMYARRRGEGAVLGFDPAAAAHLLIDVARFRSRRLHRDVPDQLTLLSIENNGVRDEVEHPSGGSWRLTVPFSAPADVVLSGEASRRLATLDADRWASLEVRPEYGLQNARARVTARFEGSGPDPEPVEDGGVADASVPRVRELALTIGNDAPGGGVYAQLRGRDGVFVLPRSFREEVLIPHVDRSLLEAPLGTIEGIEFERAAVGETTALRLTLRRDGEVWRTDQNVPADRTRITPLLEALVILRASKTFSYGPPPADAQLGSLRVNITMRERGAADASAPQRIQLVFGATTGAGEEALVYARREGINATFGINPAALRVLREFRLTP